MPDNQQSDSNNELLLQELLTGYHDIAQQLYESEDYEEAEEALVPIEALDEQDQLTFLRALSRERNEDAASILLAINTLTKRKEVRKEARRSLIRLESANVYSRWTPPELPSLSDSLNVLTGLSNPSPTVNTQADTEQPGLSLSDIQVLSDIDDENDDDDEDDDDSDIVVEDFITMWADGEYADAYQLLSSDSPLRGGLEENDWVRLREQWAEQAQPERGKVTIGYHFETGDELDALDDDAESDEDDTTEQWDAFWSLEYQETPLDSTLPELPRATLTYPLTGQHWFWSAFTLVQEDGEWFIHHMNDKGADALQLADDVLKERTTEIAEEIESLPVTRFVEEIQRSEQAEEEGIEYEPDPELAEIPYETLEEQAEEVRWYNMQAAHYTDALIAHDPDNKDIYGLAVAQATDARDKERVLAYYALATQHIPEQRGGLLRTQALLSQELLTETLNSAEEENEEGEQDSEDIARLMQQTEQLMRESLAVNKEAADYLFLAQLLTNQGEKLDEAEQLYQQAEAVAPDSATRALAEVGLGRLARENDQSQDALRHLQRATELAPDLPGVWYELGEVYTDLNQLKRAEESYIRSTELDPENDEAFAALATLWIEQGKRKEALQLLEKGIEANPETSLLRALLAIQYIEQHRYREANELLAEAENFDPDSEVIAMARQMLTALQAQSKQGRSPSKSNKHKKR